MNRTTSEELQAKRLKENKCIICGKDKGDSEYICEECFVKEMKKDMEAYAKNQERESDGDFEWDEGWRFKDSRGRSVFKR